MQHWSMLHTTSLLCINKWWQLSTLVCICDGNLIIFVEITDILDLIYVLINIIKLDQGQLHTLLTYKSGCIKLLFSGSALI